MPTGIDILGYLILINIKQGNFLSLNYCMMINSLSVIIYTWSIKADWPIT